MSVELTLTVDVELDKLYTNTFGNSAKLTKIYFKNYELTVHYIRTVDNTLYESSFIYFKKSFIDL